VLALLLPAIIVGDLLAELLVGAVESVLGGGAGVEVLTAVAGEMLTAPIFALVAVVATHQLIALDARREASA
jgi:hypothetical protein